MMTKKNEIVDLLIDVLNLNKKKIKKIENIKWDSLQHISIISNLEEKYNINFEPEEISEMTSLNKLVEYVDKKLLK